MGINTRAYCMHSFRDKTVCLPHIYGITAILTKQHTFCHCMANGVQLPPLILPCKVHNMVVIFVTSRVQSKLL